MSNDVQTLLHDLLQDDQGNYTIKTSLLGDLGTVFLPAILEQIKYIPIPRIEFEDKDWYIVIEDLVLESESFLPAVMEIKVNGNVKGSLIAYVRVLSHPFTLLGQKQRHSRPPLYQIQEQTGERLWYQHVQNPDRPRRHSFLLSQEVGVS